MRMRARHGWFVLALFSTVVLIAGPASARETIKTRVSIQTTDDGAGQELLAGKVGSREAKCKRGRTVKLFGDQPGPPVNFERLRTSTSDSQGRWVVVPPGPEIPSGRYFVKVTRDERGGDKCKAAKSQKITVS